MTMKQIFVYLFLTITCLNNGSLESACTKDERLQFLQAGYSKDQVELFCNEDTRQYQKPTKRKAIRPTKKIDPGVKTKSDIDKKNTKVYFVKVGDTLSKIARREMGTIHAWIQLYRANKHIIKDADKIYVGQRLVIPETSSAILVKPKINNTCKLVTGNNYLPFTDEKLPERGMFTEIVNTIFKNMGKKTEIEFWAWKYGFDATLEGEFDATFPYLKNAERQRIYYYSKPAYKMFILPFVLKDSPIKFKNLDDLKGLNVCRPEGYYTHDLKPLIDIDAINLKRPKELDTCLEMLVKKEVDVVPVNEFSGKGAVHRLKMDDKIKALENHVSIETLHVIFPKNNPDSRMLQYDFDQELTKLENSGKLKEIQSRHLKDFFDNLYK